MIIFMPIHHYYINIDKIKKKIIKKNIVKGVFPGYNMEDSHLASLINGHNGWNLFINIKINKQLIQDVLYFILKNKKALLFNMNNGREYEIQIVQTLR